MDILPLPPGAPNHHVKTEKTNQFTCSETIFPYECLSCPDFQTDFQTRLTHHVQSNHNKRPLKYKKRPFKCPKCRFCTYSAFLMIRHCLEENRRRSCQLCGHKSVRLHSLSLHIFHRHMKPFRRKKQVPSKIVRQVQCQHCSYKVRWSCELKSHVLAKHTPLEDIQWLYCDLCSSKFKLRKHLRQHVSERHLKTKEVTWSQCEYCPYRCKRRSELKMHVLRRHTSESEIVWHECEQCSYRTKEKKRLNEHVSLKHEFRVKKFECDYCEYKAMWCYELKRHMASKHLKREQIQWFACEQCRYNSKTKRGLKVHVASKHGQRGKVKCSKK